MNGSPWQRHKPLAQAELDTAALTVAEVAAAGVDGGRMPSLYLGHGAPPLVDDPLWVAQLATWASALPRPRSILIVSAHWESAPVTLGATRDGAPLVHDFHGFPDHYYQTTYPAPGAPGLALRVHQLLAATEPVVERPDRGLDHGAYVPLLVMYPEADVPVLQMSMPSLDPLRLLAIGERLRPLRDEAVLIIGSGFLTHGLGFLTDFHLDAPPPTWSVEFDHWAEETLAQGDLDVLADFRSVPSARYAHPSTEHFSPLFAVMGTAEAGAVPVAPITGYFLGLSKRSVQLA